MREPKAGEVPRTRSLPRPSLPSHRKGHRAHLGSPFGGGCLLLGTRRSALPSFIFGSQGPGLRCVFYTAGQISQIQPRASRSENFSSDAAPKFPTKFPRFTVPRVQRFGLGQWGNSSWTPPQGGCHNFPVSTEYYSILCNLCRDGKEKGAKSERLKVERVELRRVQEGRRHAKVRRERPGQLPSNQNGGRDILPHRRGCRPLLVPPFLSRSSPSRRRQLDHIGVPHKNGACG